VDLLVTDALKCAFTMRKYLNLNRLQLYEVGTDSRPPEKARVPHFSTDELLE